MRHGLPCADGTNRPPTTADEAAYAHALQQLGELRPLIGRAVEQEKKARELLMEALRTRGPIHPATNSALQRWRTARQVRRQAEVQVEAATFHLDGAIEGWAREAADTWSAA